MINLKFIGSIILIFSLISCRSSGKMGKVNYGEDGKIISGSGITKCSPPPKRYAAGLELKVKAQIDSLIKVPPAELEFQLSRTITKLSDFTSEGLDLSLFLFQICEMANNRGFTSGQTSDLVTIALNKWNMNEEIKKK